MENVSTRAIFISPKVYYLQTIDAEEIYKVKGLSKNSLLTQLDFETLLNHTTTLVRTQDKWYKDLSKAHIIVKNQIYTIQQTDNKRELIYNKNNHLVENKPYTLKQPDKKISLKLSLYDT